MQKTRNVSVFRNYHNCDLITGSESCLPVLPIYSAKPAKWWRQIKKYTIVDKENFKTKRVFRSHSAIMAERERHAKIGPIFLIHPFSVFAMYREHLLCVLWMLIFALEPFVISFYYYYVLAPIQYFVIFLINFLLFLNVILEFFVGYYNPVSEEIVLNPKKIFIRYLRSYFLIDLLPCRPYKIIVLGTHPGEGNYILFIMIIRLIRWKTMTKYLGELLLRFNIEESKIKWIKILLLTLYLTHWWACLFHALPICYYKGVKNLPNNSWMILGKLYDPVRGTYNTSFVYFASLITSASHFYGASEGQQHFEDTYETLMASACLITGFIFCMYFVANFLQLFGSIRMAESKYDELIYQLGEYSRVKNLPEELQNRVKTYWEYKFQKKFFKEDHILSTLSDHLRYEILLYNCRHIVEKVMALQGLSKSVVGGLIANFKLEVYLQNDVIIKSGDTTHKMYFISHGTVAIYTPSGAEITHHEDGDFFGSLEEPSFVTVVAAEITEVFYMDASDAQYIFELEEDVADRINRLLEAKHEEYRNLAEGFENVSQKNVLMNLRNGYILEKRRLR